MQKSCHSLPPACLGRACSTVTAVEVSQRLDFNGLVICLCRICSSNKSRIYAEISMAGKERLLSVLSGDDVLTRTVYGRTWLVLLIYF